MRPVTMLDLSSFRWKKLQHAYGTAQDTPELIRAIESEETPTFEDGTPWFEVYSSLCHQYSIYSATYAAFPHIVKIAEDDGIWKRAATLELAGIICIHGVVESDIDDDLTVDFNAAMRSVQSWSLDTIRRAKPYELVSCPSLLKSFGGLYYPYSAYVRQLDRLIDGEVEASCPKCNKWTIAELRPDGVWTMCLDERGQRLRATAKRSCPNRNDYADRLTLGREILDRFCDGWAEPDMPDVLAALALECGDTTLATQILDMDSIIMCVFCDQGFQLSVGLG